MMQRFRDTAEAVWSVVLNDPTVIVAMYVMATGLWLLGNAFGIVSVPLVWVFAPIWVPFFLYVVGSIVVIVGLLLWALIRDSGDMVCHAWRWFRRLASGDRD